MCDRWMTSTGGDPYFYLENSLTTSQTMSPQGLKRIRVINDSSSSVSGRRRLHPMWYRLLDKIPLAGGLKLLDHDIC